MNDDANQTISKTQFQRLEQYKDRWTSYGSNTGILEISEKLSPKELKKYEIFQDYDEKFLEKISADVSITKWKKDAILFEEGSYLNLAFFIIQGNVEVYLKKVQDGAHLSRPRFDPHRTIMFDQTEELKSPQEERFFQDTIYHTQIKKQDTEKSDLVFLSVMDFNLPVGNKLELGPGEIFGEIGALSGWPQSVTAQTATECDLVQIRVPALRLMKRRSKSLKERIDKLYRERSLFSQLKNTPLFQACDDAFIESLTKKVELVSGDPDEVITKEGEPADALYLVRSGFVKLSQTLGDGEIVVSYLSKGMTLGEVGLLIEGMEEWAYTASSVEYSELVKISREDFHQIITNYPKIEKLLWEFAVARIKESGFSKKNINQSEFIDTAVNTGLVQGNSILVIDLNVCTRCDDCVRACAETHGGLPRFVREGDKYENFLITRACYHCRDPVCLIGCPTGAIHRTNVGDVVAIDDNLCIGCQSCANNCPYDAITMYETGEVWPANMIPEGLRGKDRLLATKCDLCYQSSTGPACVRNCPHGCAFRIGSLDEFQKLLSSSD